jgi:hypothetical protein
MDIKYRFVQETVEPLISRTYSHSNSSKYANYQLEARMTQLYQFRGLTLDGSLPLNEAISTAGTPSVVGLLCRIPHVSRPSTL